MSFILTPVNSYELLCKCQENVRFDLSPDYSRSAFVFQERVNEFAHTFQWRIQDFPQGVDLLGGHEPSTQALFGENVCENERIWSDRGACTRHAPLDPPMHFASLQSKTPITCTVINHKTINKNNNR